MFAKNTRSSIKVNGLTFPEQFELNMNQSYDFSFDFITFDYECDKTISFQFSLRYPFSSENDTASYKQEIFNSNNKSTYDSKKWETESVCFYVMFDNIYEVMFNINNLKKLVLNKKIIFKAGARYRK